MKSTAFLVNTSRGPIVDEAALVRSSSTLKRSLLEPAILSIELTSLGSHFESRELFHVAQVAALRSGAIGGAGLDTFELEPRELAAMKGSCRFYFWTFLTVRWPLRG